MSVDTIRAQMERNFAGTAYEGQIESLVAFEVAGLEAASRCEGVWCECPEGFSSETRYFRRENGSHGWFHDPQLGGCGGITQNGLGEI